MSTLAACGLQKFVKGPLPGQNMEPRRLGTGWRLEAALRVRAVCPSHESSQGQTELHPEKSACVPTLHCICFSHQPPQLRPFWVLVVPSHVLAADPRVLQIRGSGHGHVHQDSTLKDLQRLGLGETSLGWLP
ncbi:hypothetical protein J1605_020796 [Eschrichtius robustus]|uniref:Uncharacterized protein n=1 Tax=Eschrichtius robustus TaxID=9764 RepID=A0AB34HE76_ESCRO|nr:hypothetical protein J1605_020796 [Eschrichtius robustus]